jgi:Skp family chaperone for outer membrane proteins
LSGPESVHRDELLRKNHEGVQYFMSSNLKIRAMAFALALTLAASGKGLAQGASAAPATGNKVGIVNIQDAIANTNEGKKELDALQQRFSPKQSELKTQNDEVENLKKQLQTQSDKLSDDERTNRVKTIEVKQKNLQRNFEDAQNEFQQAEQEVVNRLGKKMLEVLEKYAKANGYSMVLDVSSPQTPVLYASPGANITKELVDAYNAEVPVGAPAATKPATGNPARPAAGGAARPPATSSPTPKKPQ